MKKFAAKKSTVLIATMSLLWVGSSVAQTYPTHFSNIGGIINTRHNMTQSTIPLYQVPMDSSRNDYGEVCVYCHTPHAANVTIALPLWNRTNKATTYTTYNSSTITQPVSQPGPNSLSCLSCHDGTVAIDSIINMPTTPQSAGYNANQETTVNAAFLNTWNNPVGRPDASSHRGLNSRAFDVAGTTVTQVGDGLGSQGCINCHSPLATGTGPNSGDGPDFTVYNLGTDLSNDHPVGIRYPSMGPGVDFNPISGTSGNIAYFDTDGNGNLDTKNLRLYNTGAGFEVECASCHDPHGVPSNGPGTSFIPTFMRVSNSGSALCLTCHVK